MLTKTAARSSSHTSHTKKVSSKNAAAHSVPVAVKSSQARAGGVSRGVGRSVAVNSVSRTKRAKDVVAFDPFARTARGVSRSVNPQPKPAKIAKSLDSTQTHLSVQRLKSPRKKTSTFRRAAKRTLRDILLSKMLHTGTKVLLVLAVVGASTFGVYKVASRSFASDVVISKSEIVARVGKIANLPAGVPDEVVRVQDPEVLRSQNEFYANVSEGDYVLMYPSEAIIYSLKKDRIVNAKSLAK
jgi:hypothetical protein